MSVTPLGPTIAVVDLSTLTAELAKRDNVDLILARACAVNACDLQRLNDFGPRWSLYGAPVCVVDRLEDVSTDATGVIVIGDDPDEPDALGDHFEVLGKPSARIFARPIAEGGGNFISDPELSLSSVLAHELLEMIADPTVNEWEQRADGILIAREVCDPVEADSYTIETDFETQGRAVRVSNFVFPAWFDPQDTDGPFDKMGTVKGGPFALAAGGYAVTMTQGSTSQIFAETKRLSKKAAARRLARGKRSGRRISFGKKISAKGEVTP